jgi:hypothetical protein
MVRCVANAESYQDAKMAIAQDHWNVDAKKDGLEYSVTFVSRHIELQNKLTFNPLSLSFSHLQERM